MNENTSAWMETAATQIVAAERLASALPSTSVHLSALAARAALRALMAEGAMGIPQESVTLAEMGASLHRVWGFGVEGDLILDALSRLDEAGAAAMASLRVEKGVAPPHLPARTALRALEDVRILEAAIRAALSPEGRQAHAAALMAAALRAWEKGPVFPIEPEEIELAALACLEAADFAAKAAEIEGGSGLWNASHLAASWRRARQAPGGDRLEPLDEVAERLNDAQARLDMGIGPIPLEQIRRDTWRFLNGLGASRTALIPAGELS